MSGWVPERPQRSQQSKKGKNMKIHSSIRILTVVAALAAGVTAFGAETEVRREDRPTTTPPAERPGRGPRIEVPRIEVPSGVLSQLPQALQDQIARYRELSQTFISGQRELTSTLRAATEEERNRIREQLRANRERFLTDTQTLRTEIRDQLREIRHTLREQQDGTGTGGGQGRGRGGDRPRG
jgi:hypothetical protein